MSDLFQSVANGLLYKSLCIHLHSIDVEYIPVGRLLRWRVFAFVILIVIAKLSSQGIEPVFSPIC